MSGSITNQLAFLRVQRLFPQEAQPLSVEVDRAYTDIVNAVNIRALGVFSENVSVQDGESWFFSGSRHQGLRQIYRFTSAGSIAHGLNFTGVIAFTHIYGTFTDGTNWYPLPYVDTTSTNNDVSLAVTPTNIVITSGAGSPPAITLGFVVLEWIVQS